MVDADTPLRLPIGEGFVTPGAASAAGSAKSLFRDSVSDRALPCPRSCPFPGEEEGEIQ